MSAELAENPEGLRTLAACREWLDANRDRACDVGVRIVEDPSWEACTFGPIAAWTPEEAEDDCEQWKHAVRNLSWCDPGTLPSPDAASECISDAEAMMRYGMTVAQCAEYLYGRYPCTVPVGDERDMCSDLLATPAAGELTP